MAAPVLNHLLMHVGEHLVMHVAAHQAAHIVDEIVSGKHHGDHYDDGPTIGGSKGALGLKMAAKVDSRAKSAPRLRPKGTSFIAARPDLTGSSAGGPAVGLGASLPATLLPADDGDPSAPSAAAVKSTAKASAASAAADARAASDRLHTERERAVSERERQAADRERLVEERERAVAARERIAAPGMRAAALADRERVAADRERGLAAREARVADRERSLGPSAKDGAKGTELREKATDAREKLLAERERLLGERERAADRLEDAGGDPDWGVRRSRDSRDAPTAGGGTNLGVRRVPSVGSEMGSVAAESECAQTPRSSRSTLLLAPVPGSGVGAALSSTATAMGGVGGSHHSRHNSVGVAAWVALDEAALARLDSGLGGGDDDTGAEDDRGMDGPDAPPLILVSPTLRASNGSLGGAPPPAAGMSSGSGFGADLLGTGIGVDAHTPPGPSLTNAAGVAADRSAESSMTGISASDSASLAGSTAVHRTPSTMPRRPSRGNTALQVGAEMTPGGMMIGAGGTDPAASPGPGLSSLAAAAAGHSVLPPPPLSLSLSASTARRLTAMMMRDPSLLVEELMSNNPDRASSALALSGVVLPSRDKKLLDKALLPAPRNKPRAIRVPVGAPPGTRQRGLSVTRSSVKVSFNDDITVRRTLIETHDEGDKVGESGPGSSRLGGGVANAFAATMAVDSDGAGVGSLGGSRNATAPIMESTGPLVPSSLAQAKATWLSFKDAFRPTASKLDRRLSLNPSSYFAAAPITTGASLPASDGSPMDGLGEDSPVLRRSLDTRAMMSSKSFSVGSLKESSARSSTDGRQPPLEPIKEKLIGSAALAAALAAVDRHAAPHAVEEENDDDA